MVDSSTICRAPNLHEGQIGCGPHKLHTHSSWLESMHRHGYWGPHWQYPFKFSWKILNDSRTWGSPSRSGNLNQSEFRTSLCLDEKGLPPACHHFPHFPKILGNTKRKKEIIINSMHGNGMGKQCSRRYWSARLTTHLKKLMFEHGFSCFHLLYFYIIYS